MLLVGLLLWVLREVLSRAQVGSTGVRCLESHHFRPETLRIEMDYWTLAKLIGVERPKIVSWTGGRPVVLGTIVFRLEVILD